MMQYDRSHIQAHVKNEDKIQESPSIRVSENLTYLFRMFLISMLFIVVVLSISQ